MKTFKLYFKETKKIVKSAVSARSSVKLIVIVCILILLALFTKVVFGVVNFSIYSVF